MTTNCREGALRVNRLLTFPPAAYNSVITKQQSTCGVALIVYNRVGDRQANLLKHRGNYMYHLL